MKISYYICELHFYFIVGVRGFEPLHLGIKNQRLYLLAILRYLTLSGSGIEPLYMDFQSIALPLSYPVFAKITELL